MINFKKRVQEIENTRGYCSLLTKHYSTIEGIRTNCTTGITTSVKVHWRIEEAEYGKYISFLDGVTGYESYYLRDLAKSKEFNQDDPLPLCICAGTATTLDMLIVDGKHLKQIVTEALTIYK